MMTIDADAAAEIANGVVGGLFVLELVVLLGGLARRRLPTTGAVRTYLLLLGAALGFRAVQLCVPNSVYGLTDAPADEPRYSGLWWATVARFCVYALANAAHLAQSVWLIKLCDVALHVLHHDRGIWTGRALTAFAVFCAAWQVMLIGLCFAPQLQYSVVLSISACSWLLFSALMGVLFPWFWARLFSALSVVTGHRNKCDALRESLSATFALPLCCGCVLRQGADAELGVALNDTALLQLENVRSARLKLTRFTLLAGLSTVAAAIKACVLAYMTVEILRGGFSGSGGGDGSPAAPSGVARSWPLVVFLDYLLTEVAASAGTLAILWKRPRPPQQPGAPTRKSSSELAAEDAYNYGL